MASGLFYIGIFFWGIYTLFFAEGYDEFEWYYYFFFLVGYPAIGIYAFRQYIIDFFKSNRDRIKFKLKKMKKVKKTKSKKISLFESSFFQYLKNNQIVTAVLILVLAFVLWKLLSIFSCMSYNYYSFSSCLYIDMVK